MRTDEGTLWNATKAVGRGLVKGAAAAHNAATKAAAGAKEFYDSSYRKRNYRAPDWQSVAQEVADEISETLQYVDKKLVLKWSRYIIEEIAKQDAKIGKFASDFAN
jgi:hypothetical protein